MATARVTTIPRFADEGVSVIIKSALALPVAEAGALVLEVGAVVVKALVKGHGAGLVGVAGAGGGGGPLLDLDLLVGIVAVDLRAGQCLPCADRMRTTLTRGMAKPTAGAHSNTTTQAAGRTMAEPPPCMGRQVSWGKSWDWQPWEQAESVHITWLKVSAAGFCTRTAAVE